MTIPDSRPLQNETDESFNAAAEALQKLIAAGAAPDRIADAIGRIVASWADEPEIVPEMVKVRVAALWDGFSRDAADLQEQLDDIEAPAGAPGRRVLTALNAAAQILEIISARLG